MRSFSLFRIAYCRDRWALYLRVWMVVAGVQNLDAKRGLKVPQTGTLGLEMGGHDTLVSGTAMAHFRPGSRRTTSEV